MNIVRGLWLRRLNKDVMLLLLLLLLLVMMRERMLLLLIHSRTVHSNILHKRIRKVPEITKKYFEPRTCIDCCGACCC